MFGTHFYHKRVHNAVKSFGALFNDIYIINTDSSDKVLNQLKVPLSYAPRRKFEERIREMDNGEDLERQVAIKLPRMSFEIVALNYDPARQMQTTNQLCRPGTETAAKMKYYVGTPYMIQFQLNIYAHKQEDCLQVVEQIVPYFKPQYNITIKPLPDVPDYKEDIPITLQGVTFLDDFEGTMEQRRTIIYTLEFEMKVMFYGPTEEYSSLIRQVQADLIDQDKLDVLESVVVTPDPIDADPHDDYGFNVDVIPGFIDSA